MRSAPAPIIIHSTATHVPLVSSPAKPAMSSRPSLCLAAAACAWLAALDASRAAAPAAYRGAKILTAAGKTHDPGTLVIQDGKIVAVGPAAQVKVPEGAACTTWRARRSSPAWWTRIRTSASCRGPSCRAAATATRTPAPSKARAGPRFAERRRSRHPHGHGRRRHHGQHHARQRQRHRRADDLRQAPRPHRRGDAHRQPRRARRPEDGQRREPQAHFGSRGAGPGHAHEDRRPAARGVRQGPATTSGSGTATGSSCRGRKGPAAGGRPGAGAARRGAGAEADRPLPLPPRRRHPDDAAAHGGVRLRARAAARHRGLPRRRRARQAEGPRVADAGRQPRRQGRGDRPHRGERGAAWTRPASRSPSTPTIHHRSRFFLRTGGDRRPRRHARRTPPCRR